MPGRKKGKTQPEPAKCTCDSGEVITYTDPEPEKATSGLVKFSKMHDHQQVTLVTFIAPNGQRSVEWFLTGSRVTVLYDYLNVQKEILNLPPVKDLELVDITSGTEKLFSVPSESAANQQAEALSSASQRIIVAIRKKTETPKGKKGR